MKRKNVIGFITAIALIAGVTAFRGAGHWLVVDDRLEKSGAIVVLSGGTPYRALDAAEVYRQGLAPQVWLTHPVSPADTFEEMGIDYRSEESYNREVLRHEGVPASAIHTLDPIIENTEEEEQAIAAEMRRNGLTRVIIVTSPSHTRRVKAIWRRIAPPGLAILTKPAQHVAWDADHWWRTTRDSLAVVREYLGLMNTWAGLPVRPAAH